MSKVDFARKIIDKISKAIGKDGSKYTNDSARLSHQAVAAAITEYIVDNLTVDILYKGVLTGGGSDPVVEDTIKVTGTVAPFTPTDSFESWISEIQSNISSGIILAPPGASQVTTSMNPIQNDGLTAILTRSVVQNAMIGDVQVSTWEAICDKIIVWLNSTAVNPVYTGSETPATRPGSTGTAKLVKLKIS